MIGHPVPPNRTPPVEVKRTTSWGADQFILGCTARRYASDRVLREIEHFEAVNEGLRKEVAWAQAHSVTRTARYIRSRIFIMACLVATALAPATWLMISDNGRTLRVGTAAAVQQALNPSIRQIDGSWLLIRDMPQTEIDSLVRIINTYPEEFVRP